MAEAPAGSESKPFPSPSSLLRVPGKSVGLGVEIKAAGPGGLVQSDGGSYRSGAKFSTREHLPWLIDRQVWFCAPPDSKHTQQHVSVVMRIPSCHISFEQIFVVHIKRMETVDRPAGR